MSLVTVEMVPLTVTVSVVIPAVVVGQISLVRIVVEPFSVTVTVSVQGLEEVPLTVVTGSEETMEGVMEAVTVETVEEAVV